MSLTSYRAAPPRVTMLGCVMAARKRFLLSDRGSDRAAGCFFPRCAVLHVAALFEFMAIRCVDGALNSKAAARIWTGSGIVVIVNGFLHNMRRLQCLATTYSSNA